MAADRVIKSIPLTMIMYVTFLRLQNPTLPAEVPSQVPFVATKNNTTKANTAKDSTKIGRRKGISVAGYRNAGRITVE